jgi:RNA polymerase sigma-70 factor, ECF subfamily
MTSARGLLIISGSHLVVARDPLLQQWVSTGSGGKRRPEVQPGYTPRDVANDRDLTGLLQAWSEGDRDALAVLATVVHQDLRELARRILADERRDGRWRPTELVNESYLRLLDWSGVQWQNRAHFFATAARMMRRVLVDAARARRAAKRGDGIDAMPLDDMEVAAPGTRVDVIALEDALDALAAVNPRAAQVVELRFFGGFSVEETAHALDMSVRTVINDWNTARAWLYRELATRERR